MNRREWLKATAATTFSATGGLSAADIAEVPTNAIQMAVRYAAEHDRMWSVLCNITQNVLPGIQPDGAAEDMRNKAEYYYSYLYTLLDAQHSGALSEYATHVATLLQATSGAREAYVREGSLSEQAGADAMRQTNRDILRKQLAGVSSGEDAFDEVEREWIRKCGECHRDFNAKVEALGIDYCSPAGELCDPDFVGQGVFPAEITAEAIKAKFDGYVPQIVRYLSECRKLLGDEATDKIASETGRDFPSAVQQEAEQLQHVAVESPIAAHFRQTYATDIEPRDEAHIPLSKVTDAQWSSRLVHDDQGNKLTK
ncbi:MAG: hypothetical protein SFX19_00735 [Alphaproteobacteria bacterium]|nr:hypothetical protein [Alphaproteobacteria bacterium]